MSAPDFINVSRAMHCPPPTGARQLAKVEIPSYAGTEHYPVRAEIAYADGTVEIGGME